MTTNMLRRRALTLALAALLAGCAAPPAPPPSETAPHFDDAHYLQALRQGRTVWRIDPQRSLLTVLVRRGGALARLGHDHVVASHALQGFVAPREGYADLRFRLDELTVDEPALRALAGLDGALSADAVDGTRRNMLAKALDAARFPLVAVHIERAGADAPAIVHITLHGVTRTVTVPLRAQATDEGIVVAGQFDLRQSDFGIVPLSLLGGALAVEDKLALRFEIAATRWSDTPK